MSLLQRMTLRLTAVALLCLGLALAWVGYDANRTLTGETASAAGRFASELNLRLALGSAGATPEMVATAADSVAIAKIIGSGICLDFVPALGTPHHLCGGQWGSGRDDAPAWFATSFAWLFPAVAPTTRPIVIDGQYAGTVGVVADPVAWSSRAWRQVSAVATVAGVMVGAMTLLASAVVGHAVLPARALARGCRKLEEGDLTVRLPAFRGDEFGSMAAAFNDLARRLEQASADRAALMRKLFQVQEDERRSLVRELHDEFGQCLTAVGAIAASIDTNGSGAPPDVVDDARSISRLTSRMMATLKDAFRRLRPPDLDEVGLEASLRNMVNGWNLRLGKRTEFVLAVEGDLSGLSSDAGMSVYRIAQECLTNTARHGTPRRVVVRVTCDSRGGAVALAVDDDGGGDPEHVRCGTGLGIIGIRERVDALGGILIIEKSDVGGVSVAALIPAAAA